MIGGCVAGQESGVSLVRLLTEPRVFHEAGCPTDGQERSRSVPNRIRDLPNWSTGTVHLHNEAAPAVRSYLMEGASACQDHAVNESSTAHEIEQSSRLGRADPVRPPSCGRHQGLPRRRVGGLASWRSGFGSGQPLGDPSGESSPERQDHRGAVGVQHCRTATPATAPVRWRPSRAATRPPYRH